MTEHTVEAIEAATDIDVLCDIYDAWIKAHPKIDALEPQSADSLLIELQDNEVENETEIDWLHVFLARWDAVEYPERNEPPKPTTLRQVLPPHWHTRVDAKILDMTTDDGLAASCLATMQTCDTLIRLMPDAMMPKDREDLLTMAARQCRIFYFG
jgi:hypothetical protein